jgi:hypothetical protein
MLNIAAAVPPSRMRIFGDMGHFADEVLARIQRAQYRADVE